jgi:hypothetical protein
MHSVPQKENSVLPEGAELYIEKELVESKIAILRGKGSENNTFLLKTLALEGSLIKYDLFKALKETGKETHYPTISRRVDDLLEKGYLRIVGRRTVVVGKRRDKSAKYGITWKGLIASLTMESVARNILKVIENNPQLKLPFPREVTVGMIREIFTDGELASVAQALVTGYLRAIPKDLELLKHEQLLPYFLAALTEAPPIQERLKEKDLSRLLQIPQVSEFVNNSLNDAEKTLEASLLGIRELRKYLSPKEETWMKSVASRSGER